MSELCRLTIKVDLGAWLPNKMKKYKLKTRMKMSWPAWTAAKSEWLKAGSPKARGKVGYELIVRRAREADDDNLIAAFKNFRDGIFVNAITPDDSPRYVKFLGIEQEIDSRWFRKEEVEVIVKELTQTGET